MDSSQVLNVATVEADVVIIGGGGTGLAAAISAAEKGAKVVLLEKQAIGGNSAMAQGILAAESQVQKSMNIVALKDEVFRIAMEYCHWSIDPRIFRAFLNKSADTIDWLEEMGLSFQVHHVYPGQSPRTWHVPDGGGAALVKALRKTCEDLDVRLLTHCPAKRILTGENGEVVGVLATTKEQELRIIARSVIIASGGYGGNKELLKQYFPSYSENMHCQGLRLMGDGLLMAIDIGAGTEGLGHLMLQPHLLPKSKDFSMIPRDPRGLWINNKGVRFTGEQVGIRATECGNAVNRQPDKCVYVLWDEEIKSIIEKEASAQRPLLATRGLIRAPLTDLDKKLQTQAEKGRIRLADSWDEIANWMGLDPDVLNATIEEYNSACDRGYDEVFAKDRCYLQPLRTPPYYAIRCYLSFLTTIGGIKINHHMEVLNRQDDPIPGLYAGGDSAGGWESESYTMVLAGSAFGFAVNSGRIAGENAAKHSEEVQHCRVPQE